MDVRTARGIITSHRPDLIIDDMPHDAMHINVRRTKGGRHLSITLPSPTANAEMTHEQERDLLVGILDDIDSYLR